MYEAFDKVVPRHPLIVEAIDAIKARREAAAAGRLRRRPAPPKCCTGSAPRSDGAAARISALVYLQLALYLAPNHPLALMSLADLYEPIKKPRARDQGL